MVKKKDVGRRADYGLVRKEKSKSGSLWGVRQMVRRIMNGVGREPTVDVATEKRAKLGSHLVQGEGKEEDECCQRR